MRYDSTIIFVKLVDMNYHNFLASLFVHWSMVNKLKIIITIIKITMINLTQTKMKYTSSWDVNRENELK